MRFCTLFPQGSNIHLIKDVGQIPYTLQKYYNIEAVLVSNHIVKEGDFTNEVSGLQYDHTPYVKWIGQKISACLYLIINAKKIDWLNIYHAGFRAFYWTKIYKFINPNGKVYLKLDMNLKKCDELDSDIKYRKKFDKYLKGVDLVSVESVVIHERIQKYTSKDIFIIPNGFFLNERESNPVEKENIFLTVGRLGTKEKATEILLEAFAICSDKHNWNLRLVGSIEEEFQDYIKQFFAIYPKLKSRVEFTGVINNRELLKEEYQRAKIFVLSSRWEAFSLVLPEATSQGCKLILTSAIPCCKEFVCKPEFGEIVPVDNAIVLAETMARMANSYEEDNNIVDEIIAHAQHNFSWKKICKTIYDHMQNII